MENIPSVDAFHKRSITYYRDEESRENSMKAEMRVLLARCLPTVKDVDTGA